MQQKSTWDFMDSIMQMNPQQAPMNHVMIDPAMLAQGAQMESPKPARKIAAVSPQPMPKPEQMMTPMPQQSPNAGIEQSFLGDLTNRQAYVKQLQERLMAQPQGQEGFDLSSVNLKPMLAYADSLMGTNTAQSYTAPTAKKEQERLKLQGLLDKENQALTDDKLNYLKFQELARVNNEKLSDKDNWLKTWERMKMAEFGLREEKMNTKELTQNMIKNLNEGNAIPAILEDVETSITNNSDIFDPIKGRAAAMNPYNSRVGTLDAQLRAASQAFGKFMEGGVLKKEDEDKYRKMFPQVGDTPEVAQNKLALVKRQLINKQKSDLAAFRAQGYDLSGLDKGFAAPNIPDVLRPNAVVSNATVDDEDAQAEARRRRIQELESKRGK